MRKNLAIVFAIMLIIVCPLFFVGGPTAYSTPLFRALWDCGHVVFFSGLMVVLQAKINLSDWRNVLWVSLTVCLLGSSIEIIQAYTGRDGNWRDVVRDLTGVWLGLFWLLPATRRVYLGRMIALLLFLPDATHVLAVGYSQARAMQQFPVLADFESAIELQGWQGDIERVKLPPKLSNYALKVHFNKAPFSGVSFNHFFHTWQGYNTLSLDVYNPDLQPINLVLRVDDVQHELWSNLYQDRFNRRLRIVSGWSHIDIAVVDILHAPANRLMQLDSISSMVIFTMKSPVERDIYLDNLKLQ